MTPTAFLQCAAAVSDPTRLMMLFRLGDGPLRVGQLARTVDVTSSVTTYHVALLEEAGLVAVDRRSGATVVRRIERRWHAILGALATAE